MQNFKILSSFIYCVFLIAGCGGGGGSGTTTPAPIVSSLSFPLQSAYLSRVKSGATDNFTLTGTCTGTATISMGIPTATIFQGISGFSIADTLTVSTTGLTNCASDSNASIYFDTNYNYIGFNISSLNQYGLVSTITPVAASVHVGDTAVFANPLIHKHNSYGDYGIYGEQIISYVIEADTATTAIVGGVRNFV